MTNKDRGTDWFLAQLKPNCGNIAERNLRQQGFRTFLPMEVMTKRARGRFVTVPTPLFPGYIFVSLNPSEGHWRKIRSTYGITRLICFGKEPARVPLDIVGQLMLRCDASGNLLPPTLLQPGARVRLSTGPFADFVGTIEALAPERRVWVLMDILGAQTRVDIGAEQVQSV